MTPPALPPPIREDLSVFLLDAGNRMLWSGHFIGETDHVNLPVREIIRQAVMHDARWILMHHSHPSGDPHPSRGDILATRELARALRPLDIRIIDHVISAGEASYSFRAHGLL